MSRTQLHDHTRGDLCPCERCHLQRLASLACSRADAAIQAAAWHPRSRRVRAVAAHAIAERATALAAYRATEVAP